MSPPPGTRLEPQPGTAATITGLERARDVSGTMPLSGALSSRAGDEASERSPGLFSFTEEKKWR
jgi:hypothetical protein